jgi:uncharacterized membrane protein
MSSESSKLVSSSLPWHARLSRDRGRNIVFAAIGLMMVYVLFHNESFVVKWDHPIWEHYEPFKWWLLPHALTAACALLLGPFQFWDRLRQRHLKLHRVMGRIYVGGVMIGAPLGWYIQRINGPFSFEVAAGVNAVLLMLTTGIALGFALKGRIRQHRQWMTRSYAVAIVFLEVRVILGLTGWETLGDGVAEIVVWTCLVFSLLLADVVLQWQELRKSHTSAQLKRAEGIKVGVIANRRHTGSLQFCCGHQNPSAFIPDELKSPTQINRRCQKADWEEWPKLQGKQADLRHQPQSGQLRLSGPDWNRWRNIPPAHRRRRQSFCLLWIGRVFS